MIWDILSGAELCSCKGHEGPVTHVAFSPDGKHLLTCSEDGTLRVWEMPS
jgi:WD40 repeat protein